MSAAPVPERSIPNPKNIEFYNEIAINYDVILNEESSNEVIRKRVKEKFISIVKPGRVLDFGGGTGRDLDWLLHNDYQVVFCEPSEGMRKKAIDQYEKGIFTAKINFLDNDKTDFTNWPVDPPFSTPVDAILSDFAVLNCIADIDLLFKNFTQVIKPGGHLIVLMLQRGYKKSWWWKLRESIRSSVSRRPLVVHINYKEHQQTVYVYSADEIKSASIKYFDLYSMESLFEFTLFHFVKK